MHSPSAQVEHVSLNLAGTLSLDHVSVLNWVPEVVRLRDELDAEDGGEGEVVLLAQLVPAQVILTRL